MLPFCAVFLALSHFRQEMEELGKLKWDGLLADLSLKACRFQGPAGIQRVRRVEAGCKEVAGKGSGRRCRISGPVSEVSGVEICLIYIHI